MATNKSESGLTALVLIVALMAIQSLVCEAKPEGPGSSGSWSARDIAIIVNDSDPLSVRIGEYYQKQRSIPSQQVIHVRFKPNVGVLTEMEFVPIKAQVDQNTPKHVQGYVLTWLQPYRVACMSITTAFATRFDKAFCAEGCKPTRHNPYYDSISERPYDDFQWRPTMTLAAEGFTDAKNLIDRGITADNSLPKGSAYLLKTSDEARSSRAIYFPSVSAELSNLLPIHYLEQDTLENKKDVLFYFTGLTRVDKIRSNKFLPGAIADHLTSAGGILKNSYQMSSLQWLKDGATASYGAVVEPCNFPEKFPNPLVVMKHYLKGSSLIEAYWKSVAQPGQGIFIGEPLAKPFTPKPR